ncbi:MAG TPA: response regulator [Acidimicrobiales bacterium]|nr:response regulator [Acidimicrobiales bacterium]
MALILIVTDEPDILLELRRDLEAHGHESVLAADADTAMKRLSVLPIEAVVLDVMMPVRDGWTVLEALGDGRHRAPVIVVSGRAGPLDLARARRMGAFGSLAFPVSAEQLNQAVAQALVSG